MCSDCSFDLGVKASTFSIIGRSKSLSNGSTFADFLLENSTPNDDGLSATGLFELPRLLGESLITRRLNVETFLDLVGVHGSGKDMVLALLGVFGTCIL